MAVRVGNLERSIRFFADCLGARQLTAPLPIDQSGCHSMFGGPPGGEARFAFIGFESLEQPAFELIEFVRPDLPTGPSNTWEDGLMHWCFTAADVEGTLAKIEAAGGTQFGQTKRFGEGERAYSQIYFRDPDGNLFQLLGAGLDRIVEDLRQQAETLAQHA